MIDPEGASGSFHSTLWSLVRSAGEGDGESSRQALERLCQMYWYPLYAWLRRRGFDAHRASDLTQGLFASLLERRDLEQVDPAKGRFRSYLLGAMKHHVARERERETALKRGGGRAPLSLELEDAERRYQVEPSDTSSPERLYERRWALTVLEEAMERLRREQEGRGRAEIFDRLRGFLAGRDEGGGYEAAARELKLTEGGVKAAVHRLRNRFRHHLRAVVSDTLDGPEALQEEIRHLVAALEA